MKTNKLLNRVNKLEKLAKTLQSAPLKKLSPKMLNLLQTGLELELERLSKIFNETAIKIKSPIRVTSSPP
jgi:hypothetical protein